MTVIKNKEQREGGKKMEIVRQDNFPIVAVEMTIGKTDLLKSGGPFIIFDADSENRVIINSTKSFGNFTQLMPGDRVRVVGIFLGAAAE